MITYTNLWVWLSIKKMFYSELPNEFKILFQSNIFDCSVSLWVLKKDHICIIKERKSESVVGTIYWSFRFKQINKVTVILHFKTICSWYLCLKLLFSTYRANYFCIKINFQFRYLYLLTTIYLSIPDSSDQISQVLIKHSLNISLYFLKRHFLLEDFFFSH